MFEIYREINPWQENAILTVTGEDFVLEDLWDLIWDADDAGECPYRMFIYPPKYGEMIIEIFWADSQSAVDFLYNLWYDEPVQLTLDDAVVEEVVEEKRKPGWFQYFTQALSFNWPQKALWR